MGTSPTASHGTVLEPFDSSLPSWSVLRRFGRPVEEGRRGYREYIAEATNTQDEDLAVFRNGGGGRQRGKPVTMYRLDRSENPLKNPSCKELDTMRIECAPLEGPGSSDVFLKLNPGSTQIHEPGTNSKLVEQNNSRTERGCERRGRIGNDFSLGTERPKPEG